MALIKLKEQGVLPPIGLIDKYQLHSILYWGTAAQNEEKTISEIC